MIGLLGLIALPGGYPDQESDAPPTPIGFVQQLAARDSFGELPLSFEANQGQAEASVDFLSRDGEHKLLLSPTKAMLSLAGIGGDGERGTMQMQIVGADPDAVPSVERPLPGRVNYLRGTDPEQWQTDIPTFSRVGYRGVYPGVDLAYYGKGGQLEYDFIVAPGTDPDAIGLAFAGADDIVIDPAGELVLDTPAGEVRQAKPFVYQDIGGDRRQVEGRFALRSDDRVGFDLGAYDHDRPLVIDPVFIYSAHLGGRQDDRGQGVAVDAEGNAYVSGETCSRDFPAASPLPGSRGPDCGGFGGSDVFVTKLAPDGSMVYSTFLGGTRSESAAKIAVDAEGSVYVTGQTESVDFPTTPGAFQRTRAGPLILQQDFFITKLDRNGSQIDYSSLLGGSNGETLATIDLDADGNLYVAGLTASRDFPFTPGAFQESPCASPEETEFCESLFLAKISPEGNGADDLIYSSFLKTGGSPFTVNLAVDVRGNFNLTGYTNSTDFPTTPGAFQPRCALNPGQPRESRYQCQDAFVTRIHPGGNGQDDLVYSTFLGGAESISGGNNADFRGKDLGTGIAVDADGSIYVTGEANSPDFPITADAYQPTLAGCATIGCDAFVTKINPAGQGEADLVYSSFVGGAGAADLAQAIAVDASGRAVVTGFTQTTSFPLVDPLQSRCGCFTSIEADAYVFVLEPVSAGASDLIFSTFLGGTGRDTGADVAVADTGEIYVVGSTNSPPTRGGELGPKQFPTTPGAFQPEPVGGFDAFVSKIDLQSAPPPPGPAGLSVGDAKRVEGDRGTRLLQFSVTLARPDLQKVVEVSFRTADGSAKEGKDYQAQRGTLRFRPGATTLAVNIEVNGDTRLEPDETFMLELHRSKRALIDDATGTGTIVDDD